MRILATIFVFVSFTQVIGQPVINTSWIPSPGDNFVLQGADYNQLPFSLYGDTGLGLTGSNVTWNFSQLQLQNLYDTVRFSGTTSALLRTDNSGSISLNWNGNQLYNGITGIYYQFPLDTTFIHQFGDNTNQFLNEVQYRGWGTLLLPENVHFNNVLMLVQTNSSAHEDYYIDDGGLKWPVSASNWENDSYQWIVAGISNPILTINKSQNNETNYNWSGEPGQSSEYTTTTTDTTTTVWIYHSEFITGIQNIAVNEDLELFPNPTSDQIHITTGRQGATTVSIYDALGRLVKQQQFSKAIDISGLTSGYYILSLQFPEDKMMKQFVKI